ncbi:MAG: YHYH protein [Actinobacteria bacterium]|nr:YHYH protein [Actinomycetota bacterium]
MSQVSRRVFIKGGLAAVVLAACSDGTEILAPSSTPGTAAAAGTTAGTAATTTTAGAAAAKVMGEYTIVDETYGAEVVVRLDGAYRTMTANGLPDHATGTFPNAHNPNSISAQSYELRMPLAPVRTTPTPYNVPQAFGIGVNGIPFDPFAAEWYQNDRASGWQIEALGGGLDLGLDQNNAHVQPSGAYHYHGIPTGLTGVLDPSAHSPLVGWAADGFPIYVRYGYRVADDPASGIADLQSSYRLRSGTRGSGPGGIYDGTYVEDYEYAGTGDLDESNGRYGVTPEYPDGTYHYVLTEAFPTIPRVFQGDIDPSFEARRP